MENVALIEAFDGRSDEQLLRRKLIVPGSVAAAEDIKGDHIKVKPF